MALLVVVEGFFDLSLVNFSKAIGGGSKVVCEMF
jgi:hypothetical protein